MPTAQPKYEAIELAGDGLLTAALRSQEQSEALRYAIGAAAIYRVAARNAPHEEYEPLSSKLAAARRIEASIRAYFKGIDTESSNVRLALAYPGRKATQALLSKLREKEATTATLADLVELEVPAEKELGTILCNYLQLETMISDFRGCLMDVQANGGIIAPEIAGSLVPLLRSIYSLADRTAALYAESSAENPAMLKRISDTSGKDLSFFLGIRQGALQNLNRIGAI